jgi:hypothetical protein
MHRLVEHLINPSLALHLRQRSLCLGQPKRHFHGPIQLKGGGQFSMGLSAASKLGTEFPSAEVAVGNQRAHLQLLGQGEGLAVVISGLHALWRLAPRRNVAEETQGIRLVAPFLVLTGERQCRLSKGVCLLQAAGQQICLPQRETTEHLKDHCSRRNALLQRLRE